MTNRSHVYFVSDNHSCIRIGWTEDAENRIATHAKYGYKLLAILPGLRCDEQRLHQFFDKHRVRNRGGDTSTYEYDRIFPYVERLLQFQYATNEIKKADVWSQVDFRLWRPEHVAGRLWDGNQGLMFVTEAAKADERDCYQTPEPIVETCRKALGGTIDLDPCTTSAANERVKARHFYDERRNGLLLPWIGTVFVNPPYGGKKEPAAALFIRKLVDEIKLGNVTAAITVLNLQSLPTRWFPEVYAKAQIHGVWKTRINFIRPRTATGAKPFASSKNGTIFSYFGNNVELFAKAFSHKAAMYQPYGT